MANLMSDSKSIATRDAFVLDGIEMFIDEDFPASNPNGTEYVWHSEPFMQIVKTERNFEVRL